jgi:hypothetical protein
MPANKQVLNPLHSMSIKDFLTPSPSVDFADLERRVADLEERARRDDRELAAKSRLKELGFVFPQK